MLHHEVLNMIIQVRRQSRRGYVDNTPLLSPLPKIKDYTNQQKEERILCSKTKILI